MTTTQQTLRAERNAINIKMTAMESATALMPIVPREVRTQFQAMFDRLCEIDEQLSYLERVEIMGQDEADSFLG